MHCHRGIGRIGSSALALTACGIMMAAGLTTPASAGEMRGTAIDRAAGVHRVAGLRGSREVPGPGDPNGRGHVVITLRHMTATVCARAHWRRIGKPVAAHIHRGRRGVEGDVVVDLTGAVTGGRHCTKARPSLIAHIAQHPRRFYFNIHTAAYPAGAIRGQLHRRA